MALVEIHRLCCSPFPRAQRAAFRYTLLALRKTGSLRSANNADLPALGEMEPCLGVIGPVKGQDMLVVMRWK